MKRKILILAPILALALSGCFARIPTPTSGGGKSSGTTTTTGTSGGTGTVTTDTSVTPVETYGSLDNPITVARAREIGLAIEGATSSNTVYETKDAYIAGIVLNAPTESTKTAGTYQFNIGDQYGATDFVQFYWGKVDDNVTLPVEGDEVVLFGRLANYHGGYTIELAERKDVGAQIPLVKKSNHLTVNITVTPSEHGEVTGAPETAKTGDVIQLTATPETGYNVEYVKANGATLVENAGKYSFTVKTNTTITSSFVDQPVVKSSLQIAYEVAESLSNKAESTDVLTFTGTVIGSAGNTHIIQDGEYGMMIYGGQTAYEAAVVGKKVEVKAKVKNYNGCIETGTITSVTAAGDGDTIEPVYVASMAELNAIKQNVLVNINKAVLVEKPSSWQDDKNTNRGKFTLGEDTTQVQVSFSGFAYDADNAQVLADANLGDSLVFEKIYSTAYDSSGKVQANQLALNKNSVIKSSTPVVTPTSVTITNTTKSVVKKQSLALTATVGPEGASQKVDWEVTAGTGTAHIDNGSLVGDSVGTVSVTATAHGTTVKSDPVEFSVTPILVTGFDLDPTELSFVEGSTDTQTIAVKNVLPEDADNKEVEWSTSDSAVVTVENGVVSLANTAHANDTATITATAKDGSGVSKTCSVTVTQNVVHVGDVAIDPASLTMTVGDEDAQLTAVFTNPDNPTDKTVSWSITGTDGVASVSADGKVHAIAEGTTVVTVTTTDGGKTATCDVTVNEPVPVNTIQIAYEAAEGLKNSTATSGTSNFYPSDEAYEFSGTVTAKNNNTFFIQDGEYGMMVYGGSTSYPAAVVGNRVDVVSKVYRYKGAIETTSITSVSESSESPDVITPVTVTSLTQLATLKQNVLANIDVAVLKTYAGDWSGSNGPRHTFTVNGDDMQMTFDKYGYNATAANVINKTEVGSKFAFTSILTTAFLSTAGSETVPNCTQFIYGGTGSTIERIPVPATSISFSEGSYSVAQGDTKNMREVLNVQPAGFTTPIEYSVSGNSGVEIDSNGVLTVAGDAPTANKATVTASLTGTSLSATCEITVTSGSQQLKLTFDVTNNPGGWPTTNSSTLTNYTYTLNGVDYTFALKNVKQNSGYLMLSQPAALGLPAIAGYKLTKVVVNNSTGCSTSVNVGISSSGTSENYISGGEKQTWSTTGSSYTYTLTGTSVNTMYYLYVTNKNAQVYSIELVYE